MTDGKDSRDDRAIDRLFPVGRSFIRFNQKNDVFNRSLWDDKVKSGNFFTSYDIANYAPKKSKGFDHWDYALRNASWHLTDVVGERSFAEDGKSEGFTDFYSTQTPGPQQPISLQDPKQTTQRIKSAAIVLGAGMVGITELDKRWVYSHQYNRKNGSNPPLDLPESYRYVIVLAFPMDYGLSTTFPSALSGTTTGIGYGTSMQGATGLAQFITNLGYGAMASLNDTALSIPLAIAAGLGEYGRHGLLITPKYGPNVRLAKVFTDLPLVSDQPRSFGVREFCQICQECAKQCPVRAIPAGAPQSSPPNISSHEGITKWTIDGEKCFKFWVGMNTDCAICIRSCPYHKDYRKWYHRVGLYLAGTPFRKLMLWVHRKLDLGRRISAQQWWEKLSKS